ncbi:MAG: hypothetical protein ABJG41_14865 [Cyclobacteriaceae bacterium]
MAQHSNIANVKISRDRKCGDPVILVNLFSSPIWRLMIFNPSQAFWKLCIQFIEVNSQVISYCYNAVFQWKHGSLVTGLFLTFCGTSCMLVYNSSLIWSVFTPVVYPFTGLLPLWYDWNELLQLATIQIHSQGMVIYTCVFFGFSLIHTVNSWFGNYDDPVKRGVSYTYLLADRFLSRHIHVNEQLANAIQCLLVIGAGVLLWVSFHDPYFGAWLIIIAGSELLKIMKARSAYLHRKALLEA